MANRHEISDQEWERVKDLLPPENSGEGRPSKPNRIMLNGMLWIAKTGAPEKPWGRFYWSVDKACRTVPMVSRLLSCTKLKRTALRK